MPPSSTTDATEAPPVPFVPPINPEELERRNEAVIAFLDELAADVESEQDQRATWEVLRRSFGSERVASNRPAILP